MHIGYGQVVKNYPASPATNFSNVTNPGGVFQESGHTVLKSSWGIGGLGAYTGELEVAYTTPISGGTSTYIHVGGASTTLLESLLGGTVGSFLTGLLGGHYFEVEARLNGTMVASGTSSNSFTDPEVNFKINELGEYLIEITPASSYDEIYIKNVTTGLLGGTNTLDIHEIYYFSGAEPCDELLSTSYDGAGLLSVSDVNVENPHFLIDGDDTSSSEMSLALISAGLSVTQSVYINSPAQAEDQFNITMDFAGSGIIDLDLINSVQVAAYLNGSQVYTQSISSILDVSLLNLLIIGNKVEVSFTPNTAFDEVQITLSSVVGVATPVLNLYEFKILPQPPTPQVSATQICYNKTYTLSATADSAYQLLWYDDNDNLLATTAYNGTYHTGNLQTDTTIYVAVKKPACTETSAKVPIEIEVLPDIKHPDITISSLSD
ncbi:hypothetical protein DNG35_09865 [Mesonia sp. K7]|nr:hypothetical protein DNG35_09865 [Mesonia sp. K7]